MWHHFSLCIAVLGWPLQVTICPILRDHFHECPISNVGVLWPNGWMDQDATWYGNRPRPGDIALDGDPSPPRKGAQQPHFSGHVYCGQTVAHLSNCWALVHLSITQSMSLKSINHNVMLFQQFLFAICQISSEFLHLSAGQCHGAHGAWDNQFSHYFVKYRAILSKQTRQ